MTTQQPPNDPADLSGGVAAPVFSILVPVRNEPAHFEMGIRMLTAILEVPFELLVIHDEANDTTVPVANSLRERFPQIRLIHNTTGRGVLRAIRFGVKHARASRLLVCSVDEPIPFVSIPSMLFLMDEGCEFVSVTRYAHGGRRIGGSAVGGFLSRLANRLLRLLSASRLSDATTGMKMFTKEAFERLDLSTEASGWSCALEMGVKAQLCDLELGEVPVVSMDRLLGGESTFRIGPEFFRYLHWFAWGSPRLWRHNFGRRRKTRICRWRDSPLVR